MRRRNPGEREQTVLVCAFIGAAQMTWGGIVPVLPLYVEEFELDVAMLGPIISAFAIGRIVANLPAGIALRWWRPRRYLMVLLVLLGAVTAATGFVTDVGMLVAARVVAGLLGGAAVTVGFSVLVAGAPAARRGRVMATATIVQMGAAAVGSLLGGLAAGVAGVQGAFVASAVPLLLVIAWDRFRPARLYWAVAADGSAERFPPVVEQATDDAAPPPPSPLRGGLRGNRVLLVALAGVSFAAYFARFAGEQGLIPVLAYDRAAMSPVQLGLALAAGAVGSLLVLGPVGRWVDAGARASVVLVSLGAATGALIVLPLIGAPFAFAFAVVAYSVATSVSNIVPGVVTGERFAPRDTGLVVGVTRTAGDVGAAVGPLIVFEVAGQSTTAALVTIAAVLGVASVSLIAAMHGSQRIRD